MLIPALKYQSKSVWQAEKCFMSFSKAVKYRLERKNSGCGYNFEGGSAETPQKWLHTLCCYTRASQQQVNTNVCHLTSLHFTWLQLMQLVVERAANRSAEGLRMFKRPCKLLSEADTASDGRKHSNSTARRRASVIAWSIPAWWHSGREELHYTGDT